MTRELDNKSEYRIPKLLSLENKVSISLPQRQRHRHQHRHPTTFQRRLASGSCYFNNVVNSTALAPSGCSFNNVSTVPPLPPGGCIIDCLYSLDLVALVYWLAGMQIWPCHVAV